MAHFARVINGTVVKVHTLADEVMTDDDGVEQESLGQAFLADLHGYDPSELVQASYHANFRGHYPGAGWSYDEALDAFIPPKPDGDWVLDETTFSWVEDEAE